MAGPAAHRRTEARFLALACLAAVAVTGCGKGGENKRQDEDERAGDYPVEVTSATFPADQKLAKRTKMVIEVRNAGERTIPNVSVVVKCRGESGGSGGSPGGTAGGFDYVSPHEGNADRIRPQFVINEVPTRTARPDARQVELDPLERPSAYVNTYPLGKLRQGETVEFRWDVTAVRAGPYEVCWRVAAGLDGKAKAVASGGSEITGEFRGTVSNEAPPARVGEDGETVINEPAEAQP